MELSEYIEKRYNGVKSALADRIGIPRSRVHEMLKSSRRHEVMAYVDDNGEHVKAIFRECRVIERVVHE